MIPYFHGHLRRIDLSHLTIPYTQKTICQNQTPEGLFVTNILRMAMPRTPLRVNRIIEDTPAADMATRIITVDSTNPVFLARFLKSV